MHHVSDQGLQPSFAPSENYDESTLSKNDQLECQVNNRENAIVTVLLFEYDKMNEIFDNLNKLVADRF